MTRKVNTEMVLDILLRHTSELNFTNLNRLYADCGVIANSFEAGYIDATLQSLKNLGCIQLVENADPVEIVIPSELARAFLSSLSAHARDNSPIISEWFQDKGPQDDIWSLPLITYMERNRITSNPNALPLRTITSAFAIIKAKSRALSQDVYLLQYNEKWEGFNFIGGKMEKRDNDDLLLTVQREVFEELNLRRDQFSCSRLQIQPIKTREISKRLGLYTEYETHFFQLHTKQKIKMEHINKWFTKGELINRKGRNGEIIFTNPAYINELVKGEPSLLDSLGYSVPYTVHSSIWEWVTMDFTRLGLVISILGILLSIIFYIFS